jgi:hypothetical protein
MMANYWVVARARMVGNQRQWDALLASGPARWSDSRARMVADHYRVAVTIGPVAGTLISGATDVPALADPVAACDQLVDTLLGGLVSRAPFLRDSRVRVVRLPADALD